MIQGTRILHTASLGFEVKGTLLIPMKPLLILPFHEVFLHFRRTKGMPFIGATVAWVMTLVMIVGGILIVFAFGISFGNDVVHQWTVSILIAVFTNMTLTQSIPVKLS